MNLRSLKLLRWGRKDRRTVRGKVRERARNVPSVHKRMWDWEYRFWLGFVDTALDSEWPVWVCGSA